MSKDNAYYDLLAVITEVKRVNTKSGKTMAFVTLEDKSGPAELVVFPDTYSSFGRFLVPGEVVIISVLNKVEEGKRSLIANSFRFAREVNLVNKIDRIQITLPKVSGKAQEILAKITRENAQSSHNHSEQIRLSYIFNNKEFFSTKSVRELTVSLDLTMINLLKELVTPENVRLIWSASVEGAKSEVEEVLLDLNDLSEFVI